MPFWILLKRYIVSDNDVNKKLEGLKDLLGDKDKLLKEVCAQLEKVKGD